MELIHGGDIEGYRRAYGGEAVDFSANCNPLGLPPGVHNAVCAAAAACDRYPDPLCRSLTETLAEHEGLPAEWLLCGAGAADLIFRAALALRPQKALVLAPCFAEYELALTLTGAQVERYFLLPENGFALTESVLEFLDHAIDTFFLGNPNNPTGLTVPPSLLARIAEHCAARGITLVVDECFNGFLDQPQAHSLRRRLDRQPNLLILDAFTKLYGMAGLRLGYCLTADRDLLENMRQAGQPWAVSAPAQAAGLAALEAKQYLDESRNLVRAERAFLKQELRALGVTMLYGEANFIFFYSPLPRLTARLRERGILIRDCGNYAGLQTGYYRIAVRSRPDNLRLLAALRELGDMPDA